MRRGIAVLLLVLAGCKRTTPVQPEPMASVTPSAAPSAFVGSPVPPPVPAMPDGVDPEKFAIVTSICRAAYEDRGKAQYGFDRVMVGCRTNPPFVKPEQLPNGTIAALDSASKDAGAAEDARYFCVVDGLFHGSFTRSRAKQVLVSFTACPERDHVWDMGFPGSAVVVEETGGGQYRVVDVVKDVNLGRDACKMSHLPRPADRDVLLCGGGFYAGALDGAIGFYFTVDMSRKDDKARTWLIWGVRRSVAGGFVSRRRRQSVRLLSAAEPESSCGRCRSRSSWSREVRNRDTSS